MLVCLWINKILVLMQKTYAEWEDENNSNFIAKRKDKDTRK